MIDPTAILDARILIVDDLEVNVKLLARILGSAKYRCVSSTMDPGTVCSLHLRHRYDLIVLDLLMPDMDGFQVMEGLKEIELDGYLPVLVISAQPGHKLRALKAGARDFISKPFELAEVLARVHNQLEMHLMHKQLSEFNGILEQRVADRTSALKDSYLETIFTMTRAAEHKDEDLGSHVQRISHYSRALAVQLGLDQGFVDLIFFASPMHDIGKIGIPDQLLLKPGALTPDEWEITKRHTTMGAQILGQGTSPYLKMGADIALNHHERWDGGGYPHGARGEAIPLAARIMNICDIYDALRSKRPYKPAFDHHQACEIIIRGDNRIQPAHFDPAILAAFTQHEQMFRAIFADCTA